MGFGPMKRGFRHALNPKTCKNIVKYILFKTYFVIIYKVIYLCI